MSFPLKITRKNVKNISIRIEPQGIVRLTLSPFISEKKGMLFLESKHDWIEEKLRQIRERQKNFFSFSGKTYTLFLSKSEPSGMVFFRGNEVIIGADSEQKSRKYFQKFIIRKAKIQLPRELQNISKEIGIPFTRLTLRSQRSRWGSCSSKKTISLNTSLMRLSKELRHYIMIHELCHTKHMNHSPKFWKLVEKFCPKYKLLKKQLRQYGLEIK